MTERQFRRGITVLGHILQTAGLLGFAFTLVIAALHMAGLVR